MRRPSRDPRMTRSTTIFRGSSKLMAVEGSGSFERAVGVWECLCCVAGGESAWADVCQCTQVW
jgi:hypothetical protein